MPGQFTRGDHFTLPQRNPTRSKIKKNSLGHQLHLLNRFDVRIAVVSVPLLYLFFIKNHFHEIEKKCLMISADLNVNLTSK